MNERIQGLAVDDKSFNIFKPPPEANVKITLGSHTNAWIQLYSDSPPNAFQRWVLKVFTGIKVEKITK